MDKFTVTIHTADHDADLAVVWAMEQDCSLLHVSAVASSALPPSIAIAGSTAGTVLTLAPVGASYVPVEFGFDDFDTYASSRSFPRFATGETVTLTVQRYGEAAIANLTVVLTFADE